MNRPNPTTKIWYNTLGRDGNPVAVELLVDLTYILHRLGPKAAQSKGGKSQLMNGAIVARKIRK
jgi:hypothetical protein